MPASHWPVPHCDSKNGQFRLDGVMKRKSPGLSDRSMQRAATQPHCLCCAGGGSRPAVAASGKLSAAAFERAGFAADFDGLAGDAQPVASINAVQADARKLNRQELNATMQSDRERRYGDVSGAAQQTPQRIKVRRGAASSILPPFADCPSAASCSGSSVPSGCTRRRPIASASPRAQRPIRNDVQRS